MKSVKNSCTFDKLTQRIWLNHFNERLLEQELITSSEYRCIRQKILQECADKNISNQSL